MTEGRDALTKQEKTKTPVEDDNLPSQLAGDFVTRFYRLLKGSMLYDRKNVLIDRLAQDCLQIVRTILDSEGNVYLID